MKLKKYLLVVSLFKLQLQITRIHSFFAINGSEWESLTALDIFNYQPFPKHAKAFHPLPFVLFLEEHFPSSLLVNFYSMFKVQSKVVYSMRPSKNTSSKINYISFFSCNTFNPYFVTYKTILQLGIYLSPDQVIISMKVGSYSSL